MALSIVVCLLSNILLHKIKIKVPHFIISAGLAAAAVFLCASYILERNVFDAASHRSLEMTLPWYVIISALFVLFVIFLILIKIKYTLNKISLQIKFGSYFIGVTVLFFIGISAYHFYRIDFTDYYDFFNTHAYLNSILNIFWGQPFTETITSIYGHYAFFYYPLLKLAYALGMHNIYKVYTIITAALNIFTLLIWIRILCWNVKNRWIQFMGIVMICYISSSRIVSIYPANNPNRVFPMAVTALLISLWYKTEPKHKNCISVIGYISAAAITIWNTECGIFSAVSWAALHICSILQTKKGIKWQRAILHLCAIPFTFAAAVFICGCLNVLFGGKMLSVYEFIFPMTSSRHMSLIEIPLSAFPSAWMSIMVLTFLFLGYGIKDTIFCTQKDMPSDQSAACFSFAVLTLGLLSYPINRPAYSCFFVVLPFAAVMTAIIADRFIGYNEFLSNGNIGKNIAKIPAESGIWMLSTFVMLVMTVSCFVNIPYKLSNSKSYKDTERITQVYQWILQQKDKQALAIGNSASIFYAYLGWNPGVYYMDSSNYFINEDSFHELIEKSKYMEDNSLFVSGDFRWYLSKEFLKTHKMASRLKIDDIILEHWIPLSR